MDKSKKLIVFPDNLVRLVEIKANAIGFSFGEYVRYVLANDVRSISEEIEILDAETEKELAEAMDDVKNGRVTHVDKDHIAEFINSLADDSK